MKILFIGGSGNISSACTREAIDCGYDLYHFNRGNSGYYSFGDAVTLITGDINNSEDKSKIKAHAPFDVVVNFIAFVPEQIEADINFFQGITKQYIFISSATVYKKPADHYIVNEECPLENKYWEYARNKIACEKMLNSQSKINYTIVRPSYTYGKTWIPLALTAHDYNPIFRIRNHLPIISHGDGESLWVSTHHNDFAKAFVRLFNNPAALNNHFHITSDEVLTWDQIYRTVGRVIGIEPKLIHIPSDYINKYEPEWGAGLLGDKARSVVFDNSKIKAAVPGWRAEVSFEEGIRQSIEWYESDPARMIPDPDIENKTNQLIKKFLTG